MKKIILSIILIFAISQDVFADIPVTNWSTSEQPLFIHSNLTQEQVITNWIYPYFKTQEIYQGNGKPNLFHLYCSPIVNLNGICDLDYFIQNPYNYKPSHQELWTLAVRKYNLKAHKGLYDVQLYSNKVKIICK